VCEFGSFGSFGSFGVNYLFIINPPTPSLPHSHTPILPHSITPSPIHSYTSSYSNSRCISFIKNIIYIYLVIFQKQKINYKLLINIAVVHLPKVIVAYDCSAEADKALERALSIANPDDEIIILTVIPDADTVFCSGENIEISSGNISAKLDDLKSNLSASNLTISTRIVHGEIVTEILRASDDPEVRLIVLGYKGVSRIGNFKLGSVSGEVAKRAKKPILVVK
jgi:nucleotide-binding universal stress UspA family protein